MVTRKNVPQVDSGIRTPQADTFRALNVPFIPATRRSGVGDNANRLAGALQGFSASLSGVLGPMAADEKKIEDLRQKDMERRQGVNQYGRKFEKTGDPADAKKDAEYRKDHSYVMGFDPNASLAMTEASYQRTEGPAFRAYLGDQRRVLTEQGYMQQDENGNPTKERLTPQHIWGQHEILRKELEERYPGRTQEEYRLRFKYENELAQETQARLKGLEDAERDAARTNYRTYGPAHNAQSFGLAMQAVPPEKAWDEMVKANDTEIAHKLYNVNGKYIAGGLSAKDRADVLIEGIREHGIQDEQQATYVLEMFKHAKIDGKHAVTGHKDFSKRVQDLRLQAQSVLADAEIKRKEGAFLKEGFEMLKKKGVTYQQVARAFNIQKGFELTYGDKDSAPDGAKTMKGRTDKELQGLMAAHLEESFRERLGAGEDEGKVFGDLAREFSGSGLTSPLIEDLLKNFVPGENQQGNEDPVFNQAFKAFQAVRANNRLALDDYFAGNTQTRDIFMAIEPFVAKGQMTPGMAYDMVSGNAASGGDAMKHPEYRTEFNDFVEGADVNPAEREFLLKSFNLVFGGDTPLDPSDVSDYLDGALTSLKESKVSFNGREVSAPSGIPKEVFQNVLARIENADPVLLQKMNKADPTEYSPVFKWAVDKMSGDSNVYLKPGPGGYFMLDRTKGPMPLMHQGEPIILSFNSMKKLAEQADQRVLDQSAKDTREWLHGIEKAKAANDKLQEDTTKSHSEKKGHGLTEFDPNAKARKKDVLKEVGKPVEQKDRSKRRRTDLPPSAKRREKGLFEKSQRSAERNQMGSAIKRPRTEQDEFDAAAEHEANQEDRIRELYQDYLPGGNR